MADRNGIPRRRPVPQPQSQSQQQPLSEDWAKDLTDQFRRTLSTKRMNELSRRPGSQRRSSARAHPELVVRSRNPSVQPSRPMPPSRDAPTPPDTTMQDAEMRPASPPPSYTSLKNVPTVPTPPSDQKAVQFRHMLHSLSNTPCKWENPGLLDEALGAIPLQRIYDEAQEQAEVFQAEALSLGPQYKAQWGYQDCVVQALLKWFRREFFEWVNNPKCAACHARTVGKGMVAPLPDESARGANRVELYQCINQLCMSFERFPRYNDAFVLLQTRRGRVGEWANCFTMLCRAIGSRVRWVWNSEDHVWTEVYSTHQKRWVHVDACEEAWDSPLLYTQGWNKKLAYCIAFSADGCQDVTRRYVRNMDHALPRQRCEEGVLLHILGEIRAMRRRDIDKQERFRLNAEDIKEDADFRKLIIENLAYSVSRILPGGDGIKEGAAPAPATTTSTSTSDADAQKAAERALEQQRLRARNARRGQNDQPRDRQQQ